MSVRLSCPSCNHAFALSAVPPHGRATFERLWDVFARHKGDRCVAFDIELQQPGKRLRVRVDVNAQIRVRPSDRLVSDVEKICGAGSVVIGRAAPPAPRH